MDVTVPGWEKKIPAENNVLCTPEAYPIAKKRIRRHRLKISSRPTEEIDEEMADIAAVRTQGIVVSNKYNEAIKTASIWLSTYHLDIIQEVLGKGHTLELLDENGKVIVRKNGSEEGDRSSN